ncbi:MAG: DUF402 domain-containing protein, partial [Actinomycetota bacterium]
GSPHWAFDLERLGEDDHGVWLWGPAGTRIQRGSEKPKHTRRGFVKLITPNRWWTAVWNDGGGGPKGTIDVYVDVITPATWDGDAVNLVDLDLDVIRRVNGDVEIDDEDEFEEHRVLFGYPDHVVDKARTETARLALAVTRRDEPFGLVGEQWLEVGRGR